MTDEKDVVKKKTTKKKVTKKVAKKVTKKVVEKPTFTDWWKENYEDHKNILIVMINEFRIPLGYSACRKKYGLNLSEKQICEKIWNDYA